MVTELTERATHSARKLRRTCTAASPLQSGARGLATNYAAQGWAWSGVLSVVVIASTVCLPPSCCSLLLLPLLAAVPIVRMHQKLPSRVNTTFGCSPASQTSSRLQSPSF